MIRKGTMSAFLHWNMQGSTNNPPWGSSHYLLNLGWAATGRSPPGSHLHPIS